MPARSLINNLSWCNRERRKGRASGLRRQLALLKVNEVSSSQSPAKEAGARDICAAGEGRAPQASQQTEDAKRPAASRARREGKRSRGAFWSSGESSWQRGGLLGALGGLWPHVLLDSPHRVGSTSLYPPSASRDHAGPDGSRQEQSCPPGFAAEEQPPRPPRQLRPTPEPARGGKASRFRPISSPPPSLPRGSPPAAPRARHTGLFIRSCQTGSPNWQARAVRSAGKPFPHSRGASEPPKPPTEPPQSPERAGSCCAGSTEPKSRGIAAWEEAAAPVLTHGLLWGGRMLPAGDGAGGCVLAPRGRLPGLGCGERKTGAVSLPSSAVAPRRFWGAQDPGRQAAGERGQLKRIPVLATSFSLLAPRGCRRAAELRELELKGRAEVPRPHGMHRYLGVTESQNALGWKGPLEVT